MLKCKHIVQFYMPYHIQAGFQLPLQKGKGLLYHIDQLWDILVSLGVRPDSRYQCSRS